jgi:hypothetical protein
MGAIIIHGPQEGPWAPGYYSVLFEDPDGIRLEANFVPGAGVLQPSVKFNPAEANFPLMAKPACKRPKFMHILQFRVTE